MHYIYSLGYKIQLFSLLDTKKIVYTLFYVIQSIRNIMSFTHLLVLTTKYSRLCQTVVDLSPTDRMVVKTLRLRFIFSGSGVGTCSLMKTNGFSPWVIEIDNIIWSSFGEFLYFIHTRYNTSRHK